MRPTRLLAPTVAAGLALATAAPVAAAPPARTTILDAVVATVTDTGEFSELAAAADRLGLADQGGLLDGRRQLTVSAPTNAAFEALYGALGVDGVDEIPLDVLAAVVRYHVAPGERTAADVIASDQVNTLQKGDRIPVSFDGEVVTLDEATVVLADLDVDNGVIHVIDAVMLPGSLGLG